MYVGTPTMTGPNARSRTGVTMIWAAAGPPVTMAARSSGRVNLIQLLHGAPVASAPVGEAVTTPDRRVRPVCREEPLVRSKPPTW